MFARIRHLASHTEGHDKGKKSLLGPSSSSGRRLCVLSGNISTLHRTTSWGQRHPGVRLSYCVIC